MKPVVSPCTETRGNATSHTTIRLFISSSPEFHIQGLGAFCSPEQGLVCAKAAALGGYNSLQARGI